MSHTAQHSHSRPYLHGLPVTQGPEQGRQVLSWHSLDEALRARDLRKASLRREFAGHKQLWLASLADVSPQYFSRCLSERHSVELNADQIAAVRLGLAADAGRRAA